MFTDTAPATGLIHHRDAESMARTYAMAIDGIMSNLQDAHEHLQAIAAAFPNVNRHSIEFKYCDVSVHVGSDMARIEADLADLEYRIRQSAWAGLINKLGIRKVMSSKRWSELSRALSERVYLSNYKDSEPPLPKIEGDNMIAVLNGYMASANEFLEEAVREEYDFWRPCDWERRKGQLKTNQKSFFKLDRKVIKGYMVRPGYNRCWDANYDRQQHLIAIDNIMHCLAGLGPVAEGYHGPLLDSIRTLPTCETVGKTEFFRFKCYQNGNLHLEFLRQDLLDLFNQIASRKWIGTVE